MTIAPLIPVTCFTGFLGAGKTSTILGLLKQLPKDYKVVLLKNEYGDVEVDSLLASQSQITGVSEILNGCLCCTMVGLVENALMEIKETMNPDRIIIESSGSAFPATLALQIKEIEPKGFKLDGVVTVIDCVNFRGYEDKSPSAKLQAQYTDLLLLSKHQLLTEREFDETLDHLLELNDETPYIKVSPENPVRPELVFGLDTRLWSKTNEEGVDWDLISGDLGSNGGEGSWKGKHNEEVETRSVWRGGRPPGSDKGRAGIHSHVEGEICSCEGEGGGELSPDELSPDEGLDEVVPLDRKVLEVELGKLSFEIYRVKGILRLSATAASKGYETFILNYAFGRHEITRFPSLDDDEALKGVSFRLTVMGERGEVVRRAKRFADGLGGVVG